MRFSCDSCQAQYLIGDDKVGPNGVIVRCKKCQHRIIVKPSTPPPAEEVGEPTVVMDNPIAAMHSEEVTASGVPSAPPPVPEEGLDDDLGKAFASVVVEEPSGPSSLPFPTGDLAGAAPSGEDDPDRLSTRVMNLTEMAGLTKPEADPAADEEPKKNAPVASPAPEKPAASIEWFVAIAEKQVGPLTLEAVRGHWDKGEISPESLVWSAGMADWRPLSSVQELVKELAPAPKAEKQERPAGAMAVGPQAPAATAAGPADSSDTGWKPSAASALAALVQEELKVLEKPAPAPEPLPFAAPAGPAPGSLLDVLPPASEPVPEGTSPGILPVSTIPELPASSHLPDERTQTAAAPRPESRRPAEPAGVILPPPRSRAGLYVTLGVVGGLLGAGAVAAAVIVAMGSNDVIDRGGAPVERPAASAPGASPAAPAQPAAAEVKPAAPPAAKADVPAAEAKVEPAAPPAPPAPEAAAEAKVDEPKGPAAAEAPKRDVRRPGRGTRETRRSESRSSVASRTPEPEPEPVPPPARVEPKKEEPVATAPSAPPPADTSTAAGRNKVDEDFEKLFGKRDNTAAPAPAAKTERKGPKTVYVPPPVGGATKETLGQSDIMEVVLSNKGLIKKCIDQQKEEDPSLSGTVTMRWTIRADGSTTGIQTVTPEFQKTPLSACLAGAIKTFKFPPYSGAQMAPINFPFKF